MTVYVTLITFCAVFFTPVTALCDSPVDSRAITIDGKPFVAFDRESAQKLLQMRIDFPKLELTIQKQNELLHTKSSEISVLESSLTNLYTQKEILLTESINLHKRLVAAYAWYKSPYLWVCVGLVVGTSATILVMYATKQ